MAELDTKEREKLHKDQFAYVDKDGGAHVRNAIARFNQTKFQSDSAREEARRKVLAAAKRHGIEVKDVDNINKKD